MLIGKNSYGICYLPYYSLYIIFILVKLVSTKSPINNLRISKHFIKNNECMFPYCLSLLFYF